MRNAILFILIIRSTTAVAQFAGGSGTANDPYLVATAAQLNEVRNHLTAHFVQMADINLDVAPYHSGEGWAPIADFSTSNDASSFLGSYDGNGFAISGLFINRPAMQRIGLFGFIGASGRLRNVTLLDVDVTGNARTGALVGGSNLGHIENSAVTGQITGTNAVGGLVGQNSITGTILDSRCECAVSGNAGVGGLVGWNFFEVTRSFATGTVTGPAGDAGGLVGLNTINIASGVTTLSSVMDSYSTGEVRGATAGGLVGRNSGTIRNSYTRSTVIGSTLTGGLVGFVQNPSSVRNSYWNTESGNVTQAVGGSIVGTFEGVGGLTEAQMNQRNSFVDWDFDLVWVMDSEAGRPRLRGLPPVSIDPDGELPNGARLLQNYPNPFNPSTEIRYELATAGRVRVAVFDILGREIAVLVDADKPAGTHTATFDAANLTSGLYLYVLETGGTRLTRKMLLLE